MKTLKEQKWMIIVYGVILFAIGLTEFILSIVDLSASIRVVSYTIAIGLFIIGILHIITNLVQDTKSFFRGALILGCICIAVGVVFFVVPEVLGTFLVYFVASLVIALSAVFIAKAIIGIKFKYKVSWIVLYFLLATIGIVLSILGFVYIDKSSAVAQVVYCVMGAVIAVIGILVLVFGIKALTKKKETEE